MKNIWRLEQKVFILLILIFIFAKALGVEKKTSLKLELNDKDQRGGWLSGILGFWGI